MILVMWRDVVPFVDKKTHSFRTSALQQLTRHIEGACEGILVQPASLDIPDELSDLKELALLLQRTGTIDAARPRRALPDEPRIVGWSVSYSSRTDAGGLSTVSEHEALTKGLAEALERSIWAQTTDYFTNPVYTSASQLNRPHIPLLSWTSFSKQQREVQSDLALSADDVVTWIDAHSWVTQSLVKIPAQLVSLAHAHKVLKEKKEPKIRLSITTGLATGISHEHAALSGILEVIERDAFAIMWLNQLSLPVFTTEAVRGTRESLDTLLDRCVRHHLTVTFVRLLTDAPTYALMAVVTDPYNSPPLTLGISAGADFHRECEKALLEALRARMNTRTRFRASPKEQSLAPTEVTHRDHALYWYSSEKSARLSFLTNGPHADVPSELWSVEDTKKHLERIVQWCSKSGYECISTTLTHSTLNPTDWHVVFSAVPDLQPLHMNERYQYYTGKRLKEIPEKFGYQARSEPFLAEPHPFV